MESRFISINNVIDSLFDNPLLKNLSFEAILRYTVRFINIVGIPQAYEDKYFEGKIERHRVMMPCDMIEIDQVLVDNCPVVHASDTFRNHVACDGLSRSVMTTYSSNNN